MQDFRKQHQSIPALGAWLGVVFILLCFGFPFRCLLLSKLSLAEDSLPGCFSPKNDTFPRSAEIAKPPPASLQLRLRACALKCLRSLLPPAAAPPLPPAPTSSSPEYLHFFLPLFSMQPDFSASFLRMERQINTGGEGGNLRTALLSIPPQPPR